MKAKDAYNQPQLFAAPIMLTLKLLGTPQILLDTQVVEVKSLKARALLFYVAMAEAPVPREVLVALLWPDSAEAAARSNLRTQLATLRRVLPDQLKTTRRTVALVEDTDVDVRQFVAAPDQHTALYRDDFLASFSVPDSAEYTYWQTEQREYLRVLVADAFASLANRHADSDPSLAIEHARSWVSMAPLQEAAHRTLMELLHRSGNRADALHQYATCRRLLRDELDIAPSPQTEALHAQIRAEAAVPPLASVPTVIRSERTFLLEKVRSFWLDGVLAKNVPERASIALRFESTPEQIAHPWADSLGTHYLHDPAEGRLRDVLASAENRLLILGEPGGGKTVSLLELAAHLVECAQADTQAPLPIVLHLASWANQRLPFGEWTASEIKAKYQLPRDSAETLLASNHIVLLLDGLDEMAANAVPACITAINSWRDTQPQTGIVVCCRSADYALAAKQLRLNAAVRLLPLNRRQIDSYLSRTRASTSLRANLLSERSSQLHELARSPMMLSLMRSSGSAGNPVDNKQVLSHYAEHAFERKPASGEPVQMRQQLGWLARKMRDNHQSQFLIEEMQPAWLDSRRDRWLYVALNALLLTLIGILVFAISVIYIWYRTDTQYEIAFFGRIATALNVTYPIATLLGFALLSAVLLPLRIVTQFRHWERRRSDPLHAVSERDLWRVTLTSALLNFGLVAGVIAAFGDLAAGLALGFVIGMSRIGSARTWLATAGYVNDIQQADRIGWDWRRVPAGIVIGLAHGVVWYLAVPDLPDWYDIPAAVLLFIFVLGLQGKRLDNKAQPNHGTWLAVRNGLLAAVAVSVAVGSVILIYERWQAAAVMMVSIAIASFLLVGGVNAIKHAILRLLLGISAEIPPNYAAFLDNACTLGFLQRVGGGYVFRHRLVLDYFAEQSTTAPLEGQQT